MHKNNQKHHRLLFLSSKLTKHACGAGVLLTVLSETLSWINEGLLCGPGGGVELPLEKSVYTDLRQKSP